MKQSRTSTQLSNDHDNFNGIYQCHVVHACRYWLKQVITLVVVMGIAWIGNVLFFNANLIFVAYIMTIFIACQGIVIFILFVPLSKQVMWIVFGQKWILMLIFRWWMPIKSGGGSKGNCQVQQLWVKHHCRPNMSVYWFTVAKISL